METVRVSSIFSVEIKDTDRYGDGDGESMKTSGEVDVRREACGGDRRVGANPL